jgi:hypothetical protein
MPKYSRQDMMEMADRLYDGYRTNPDHLILAAAMLREAAGPGNATQAQLDAATKPLHDQIERLTIDLIAYKTHWPLLKEANKNMGDAINLLLTSPASGGTE